MWEERNYSDQARSRYGELFPEVLKRVGEAAGFSVSGSVKVHGDSDASVLVLHGRLRFGLDFDDVRADICLKRGEEALFEGVICADNLCTDEGDDGLEHTSVRVRECRNSASADAKKSACDVVRKAFATTTIELREEVIAKATKH